jgi:hypothetical protein
MRETTEVTSVIGELRSRVSILADDLDACGHDLAAALAEQIVALLDTGEAVSPDGKIVRFPQTQVS